MTDDAEKGIERSSSAGASAGGRHEPAAAEAASGRAEGQPDNRDRYGEECDQSYSQPAGSEVVAANQAVARVEEILEGDLDDRQVEQVISRESWEGPLPPPAALAAYERVLPGAADRAFALAERSLRIREAREDTVRAAVDGEVRVQTTLAEADAQSLRRGQYLAAAVAILIGTLSFAGLWLTPWAAIGFAVPLAQVASALVRTVTDRHEEETTDSTVSQHD